MDTYNAVKTRLLRLCDEKKNDDTPFGDGGRRFRRSTIKNVLRQKPQSGNCNA